MRRKILFGKPFFVILRCVSMIKVNKKNCGNFRVIEAFHGPRVEENAEKLKKTS